MVGETCKAHVPSWYPIPVTVIDTSSQITDNFINKVNNISYKFIDMQKKYLFRSFYYYDNPDILEKHKKEHFEKARTKYAEQWIFVNKFKIIDSKLKL